MIQRLQSVYLILTAIISVLLFFTPLSVFEHSVDRYYLDMLMMSYEDTGNFTMIERPWIPIIINILIGVLSIITFLLFKNRSLQLKFIRLDMVLIILLLLSLLYYFKIIAGIELQDGVVVYQFGSFLPMLQVVFCYLALRAVKHDEALVRSADRLR